MGVIKKKDIWEKRSVQYLEWEDFFTPHGKGETVTEKVISQPVTPPLGEHGEEPSLQVEGLLEDAQAKANQLVQEARQQYEHIKEEAFKKGFEEGMGEAERKVDEKYKTLFTTEVVKIRQIVDALQSSYTDIIRKAENSLVKLSLDIAKKIIKEECSTKETVVVNMVKEGLSRVADKTEIRVKVNPQQLPVIKEHRDMFLSQLEGVKHFEFTADSSIEAGGCVVETESGSIDLRIEKQFAEVKKSLTGEEVSDGTF